MAASIETRASWTVAFAALAILSVAYGAPLLVIVVALRPVVETFVAAKAGPVRSIPALASSLARLGVGVGACPRPGRSAVPIGASGAVRRP